jgi:hypothetical protein
MRYDAEIRIFDMLDQVMVKVRVFCTGEVHLDGPEIVIERGFLVQGVGETDPELWLADALVAVLEGP